MELDFGKNWEWRMGCHQQGICLRIHLLSPRRHIMQDITCIFSAIYEWRLLYLIPLTIACIAYAFWLLLQRRKSFFVWLLVFPLFIGPLDIAATYCGWHYRMILRQRFAALPSSNNAYSIARMPANIRDEYSRHDYHPRFRDIKAMILGDILSLPFLYAIGGLFWLGINTNEMRKKTDK